MSGTNKRNQKGQALQCARPSGMQSSPHNQ
uniref:Uncharacterized protein n=1 Tax=virus sp. ctr1v16 TaxID=2825823 RepID=A0A8S5RQH6_9VIRU|nr:MAG TPA: hypothetical protein [virus sp. ctr1v16]